MADPYKGQKVTVTCQDCGCQFEISRSRHYKIMASDNPTFRCKPCYKYWRKNVWYNELPEEKRNELSSKRSELSKGVWANMSEEKKEETNQKKSATRINHTDEWKADVRERVQNTWQNKSNEEKLLYSESCREHTQAFWDGLDELGLNEMRAKMAEAQRIYNESLTEEEKAARAERIANSNRAYWANLSDEERALVFQIRSEAQKKQWTEKSDESRNYIISRLVAGRIDWWNSLSEEEKIQYGLRHKTEFWDKMTKEEFREWSRIALTSWNGSPGSEVEFRFSDILRANRVPFETQWVNQHVHPRFDELFPINPITGSDKVSPYHIWDFKLNCRNGTILIDIDGSIHSPQRCSDLVTKNGIKFVLRDDIEFRDSKRPYETDGLPAYAVGALNDKITDETPVVDLKTGEIMSFKSLMAIIFFTNISNKDRKDIIRHA